MLDDLRKEVNKLDAELVKLLAKRMELSIEIGKEKKVLGMEVYKKTREIAILDTVKLLADSLGLSESFVTDVYALIFAESRRLQKELQ